MIRNEVAKIFDYPRNEIRDAILDPTKGNLTGVPSLEEGQVVSIAKQAIRDIPRFSKITLNGHVIHQLGLFTSTAGQVFDKIFLETDNDMALTSSILGLTNQNLNIPFIATAQKKEETVRGHDKALSINTDEKEKNGACAKVTVEGEILMEFLSVNNIEDDTNTFCKAKVIVTANRQDMIEGKVANMTIQAAYTPRVKTLEDARKLDYTGAARTGVTSWFKKDGPFNPKTHIN